MNNERILSYKMSQALSKEELQDISAAGTWTNVITGNGTYGPGGADGGVEVTWDF